MKLTPKEFIEEYAGNDLLVPDGLEAAFVGLAEVNGIDVAVYDEEKAINVFRENGMSGSEAREFFDFNVKGSYMGETGPIYLLPYTQP